MPANSFDLPNSLATGGTTLYSLQSNEGSKARYIDILSSLAAPRTLEISNEIKAVGNMGNDRHSVSVKMAKIDPITGKVVTCSATLTLSVPRAGNFTTADIHDVIVNAQSFLTTVRIDQIVDGILPQI